MTDHPPTVLSIGSLAAGAGASVETIRYYERIGLLPPPARTHGGHRTYREPHLRQLWFIRRARELGFSVGAVRQLLKLAHGCEAPCAEARELAAERLEEVRAKISALRSMEASLSRIVGRCDPGQGAECPLLETLWEPPTRDRQS